MKINKENFLINLLSILTLINVLLFWKTPIPLTIILFIIGFLMIYIIKEKKLIIVFFACGVMGSLTEIIAIINGAWFYSKPNFLGIPLWLIPLWGIAAIFMINLNNQISNYLKIIQKYLKKIKKTKP